MHAVREIAVDRRLFKGIIWAQFRPMFGRYRLMGLGIFLLSAVVWLVARAFSPLAVGLTAGGVFVILVPELMIYLGWRRVAPLVAKPWVYEVTDSSVTLTSPLVKQEYGWDAFVSAEDRNGFWVLRQAIPNLALVVVKAAFTPADQASIDVLLARRGLVPAP